MDPKNSKPATQTTISPPHGYVLNGKIMLSAIIILFSIVLLILAVHLYVRFYIYRRNSRRRRTRLIFTTSGDHTPPRGLDAKVLNSIPVLIYDSAETDIPECAVCLCEFEEGEKVRSLPKCKHLFHVGCIDMWFGSHGSCPLCRVAVDEVAEAEVTGQQCAEQESAASSSSSSSSSDNGEVSIEVSESENTSESHKNLIYTIITRFLNRNRRTELDIERGGV